jgi:xanthine/uracil permease
MLNSAALTLCFVAELAGFDALAHAFLPSVRVEFVVVITASLIVSPLWTWMLETDAINVYRHDHPATGGHFRTATAVWRFVAATMVIGALAAATALVIRNVFHPFTSAPRIYLALTIGILPIIGGYALTGAWVSVGAG